MLKRYLQGANLEHQVVARLRENEDFNLVIRSAGSHTPVDITCLGREKVVLIQCKHTTKPEVDINALIKYDKNIDELIDLKYDYPVEKYLFIKQGMSRRILQVKLLDDDSYEMGRYFDLSPIKKVDHREDFLNIEEIG